MLVLRRSKNRSIVLTKGDMFIELKNLGPHEHGGINIGIDAPQDVLVETLERYNKRIEEESK